MRKAILMLLLAVLSNSAMAEWVKVFFSDTTTLYADFASAKKDDTMVRMSNLSDYKTPLKTRNGIAYLSLIEPGEYDCKEGQMRAASLSAYSKNMGDGKMVYSEPFIQTAWIPVNAGSVDHILWKFACGKNYPVSVLRLP